jgi:hypothetical protein
MSRQLLLVSIAVAVGGFSAALLFQSWFVGRFLEGLAQKEEQVAERADALQEWVKQARWDIGGVLVSQMFTNALLAAILAVLVFR